MADSNPPERLPLNQAPEPPIVDGYLISRQEIKIDAVGNSPAQTIRYLRHLATGTVCYLVFSPHESPTDPAIVAAAQAVVTRLASESNAFDFLDETNRLTQIHEKIDHYSSAQDNQALAQLRQQFADEAKKPQYAEIPENLHQIDLVATWDAIQKINHPQPVSAPAQPPTIDLTPIKGLKIELPPPINNYSPPHR